jgi:hypothetical protein
MMCTKLPIKLALKHTNKQLQEQIATSLSDLNSKYSSSSFSDRKAPEKLFDFKHQTQGPSYLCSIALLGRLQEPLGSVRTPSTTKVSPWMDVNTGNRFVEILRITLITIWWGVPFTLQGFLNTARS